MFSTVIIGGILVAVLIAILLKMRNDKRKGKNACGYSCASCPSVNLCHLKEEVAKK